MGGLRATITINSLSPTAEVDYVRGDVEYFLHYNSKNKRLLGEDETVTLSDVSFVALTKVFAESIGTSEENRVAFAKGVAETLRADEQVSMLLNGAYFAVITRSKLLGAIPLNTYTLN